MRTCRLGFFPVVLIWFVGLGCGRAEAATFTLGPMMFYLYAGQGDIVHWSIENMPDEILTFGKPTYLHNFPGPPWFFNCLGGRQACDDAHPLESTPTPGEAIVNRNFFTFQTDAVKPGDYYYMSFTIPFQLYTLKPGATAPWTTDDFVKSGAEYSNTYVVTVFIRPAINIPEPSTFVLLTLSFVGLIGCGWWHGRG